MEIETMEQISSRWKIAGIVHTARDVTYEWERQGLTRLRTMESELLARVDHLAPTDRRLEAQHARDVAGVIWDHRGSGNWTTQGRPKQRRIRLKVDDDPTDEQIFRECQLDRTAYRGDPERYAL